MTKKLVVFGPFILLKGEMGGFKDILVLLGKEKKVQEIDKEYQKRKISGPWGLEELAKLYRGFPEDKLKQIALNYCQKYLINGVKEFIKELKKRDFLIGAVSANPQFVMDALAEILPLDFSEGTKLEFKDGITTGKIQRKVDRYIKAEILREKRGKYGLKKENIIVIGDSVTDLPMVKEAKVFIGFDGEKENAGDICKMIITHEKLRDIFK